MSVPALHISANLTMARTGADAEPSQEKPSLTFYGDLSGAEGLSDGLCEMPARQLESGLIAVRNESINE